MKIDFYTKFILTVIALSLVWICIRPFSIQTVYADRQQIIDVNIKQVSGHYVQQAVPVMVVKE